MKVGLNCSDVVVEVGSVVIVFDGVCVLCNCWVWFLLCFDCRGCYCFVVM